jgi:hypothetical protein
MIREESKYANFKLYCQLYHFKNVSREKICDTDYRLLHTENEGPVIIQYKCLVPIYVFLEMKLRRLVSSKTELIMFCLPISTFMYL